MVSPGKVVLGFILAIIGLLSFVLPSVRVFLWGSLLVGIILIINGLRATSKPRKSSAKPGPNKNILIPELKEELDSKQSDSVPKPPFADIHESAQKVASGMMLDPGPGPHYRLAPLNETSDLITPLCLKHGYSIEGCIGRGGMSEVYLALNPRGEKRVIKRARGYRNEGEKSIYSNPQSDCSQLMKNEGEFLLRTMPHPNIIRAFEIIEDEDEVLLVEEPIDGISMADYARSKEGLSQKEANVAASQILDVLEKMHSKYKYAYRDLQPNNIMVMEGKVVMIDFGGIAKIGEKVAALKMGDYHFVNREEMKSEATMEVGEWLDVFSFSNTYYYMLTGKHPPKDDGKTDPWKIMSHELKKKEIPLELQEAIQMGRQMEITGVGQFIDILGYNQSKNETIGCPFCKSIINKGSSNCNNCGAMKCESCTAWRSIDQNYCPMCGSSRCGNCYAGPSQCPSCRKEIESGWRACPYCLVDIEWKCKGCGERFEPEFVICPICGTSEILGPFIGAGNLDN